MKLLAIGLALALVIAGQVGCGKKDNDEDKDKDEKGAVESTIEYATGYTAVQAKFKAERQTIQISIDSAVNYFAVDPGRRPTSLQELVDAGCLDKKYLNDEYGKPLEVEVRDGQLVVRSMRVNKETGRRELNWSKSY
jgi:hypothetical protein